MLSSGAGNPMFPLITIGKPAAYNREEIGSVKSGVGWPARGSRELRPGAV